MVIGGAGRAALAGLLVLGACAPGGEGPDPAGNGTAGPARRESDPSAGILFRDVARETGLRFDHFIGATGEYFFPEIMGSGGALIDYDDDGDLDVYLVQGALLDPEASLSASIFPWKEADPPRNVLYRNDLIESGTLRFVDVTGTSGAGDRGYGMGVATGDYDNDGDVDLYLTNFGPDVLLRNEGDGTFRDVTRVSGIADDRWTTGAVWVDYDRDGWLDLAVIAYADFTLATNKKCFQDSGVRDYCGPDAFLPLPPRLWHNRGDGTFVNVTGLVGMDTAYGHGLGILARDFDDDGWIDLYVANDGDANHLWHNRKGRFVDAGLMSGAALSETGHAQAGMGVVSSDFDDDGDFDLFMTHLYRETNTLYVNLGQGQFLDATLRHGLGQPSLPYTGFGVAWADFDQDGDLDLAIANGEVSKVESLPGDPHPFDQHNQVLLHDGRGWYEDTPAALPEHARTSRGLAAGDIDNDGDIDLLITNSNDPVCLLRNESPATERWVLLRVLDAVRRRDAYGARVLLTLTDGRTITRPVATDGSYLSASDPRLHFTWPEGTAMRSVEVVTPEGRRLPVEGVIPGGIRVIEIGADGARVRP